MIQVLHGFQIPSSRRLRVRPHACMTTDHICNDLFPSLAQFFFSETTSTKINLVTTDFVHTRVYAYATLFYIEKATAYMVPGKLLHHLQSLFVSLHICVSFLYRIDECSLLASPLWVEVPTSKSKSSETEANMGY